MKLFFSFLRILGCDLQSYKNSNVNETLMYIPSMYQVPTRERFYEKDFKSIKPRLYGFMDLKKKISKTATSTYTHYKHKGHAEAMKAAMESNRAKTFGRCHTVVDRRARRSLLAFAFRKAYRLYRLVFLFNT